MLFKLFTLAIVFGAAAFATGCREIKIDHVKSVAISTESATLSPSTSVELVGSEIHMKKTGNGSVGCTYSGTSDTSTTSASVSSASNLSSQNVALANLFTTTAPLYVSEINLRLRKISNASGSLAVEIQSTTGGTDPSGTALATSATVLISTLTTGATGSVITFTLSSSLQLTKNTTYAIVLKPQSGATLDAGNNVRWLASDTAGPPEACSDFPIYRASSDAGVTWGAGQNSNYRRHFFTLTVDDHSTTGNATWILSGAQNSSWYMPSFSLAENSNGVYTGSVTYDVGAGESSTSATYSNTGLTKAQVQALSDLKGTYMYLKANLSLTNSYDNVSITPGSINYH